MKQLTYYNDLLVVDRAWIDSMLSRMVVEIHDRLYALDLSVARREGGRRIDEGDLLPTADEALPADAWALTGDDVHTRYRIMLRGMADRISHLHWPLEV